MAMQNANEMRDHIIKKASEDEAFRGKLLSEPKRLIEDELGITIPPGVTVQVHENSAQTVHLVLPPNPRIPESELRAATGGSDCTTSSY